MGMPILSREIDALRRIGNIIANRRARDVQVGFYQAEGRLLVRLCDEYEAERVRAQRVELLEEALKAYVRNDACACARMPEDDRPCARCAAQIALGDS